MKKHISLLECKSGQILADDIISDSGLLIIPKFATINDYVIKRLDEFGVKRITVFKQKNNDRKEPLTITQLKNEYKRYVTTIKDIFNDLSLGNELNFEKVKSISDSIYYNIVNNDDIIQCINQLRYIDSYTFTHSINVSLYAMLLANWLDLDKQDVDNAILSGILHDIGKSRIPDIILNKKGPLSNEEFNVMKTHTIIGYELVRNLNDIKPEIKEAILYHHEKYNGNGYPFGIKGSELNIYAKIISVVDVYDALTSDRCYKNKITLFESFKEIQDMDIGHFDLRIMLKFLYNIANYYIGSPILMNNGKVGEIVFISPNNISRPIVKIEDKFIDLCIDNSIKIVEML